MGNNKKLKNLGLFSGIGGFELGLEWAGIETVAFCEFDKKAQLVLKKHWPNTPIFDDVKELTYEKLKENGITDIDVITGGFPCQDISLAGKGAGITAPRSGLWKEYARLIREIRPKYVIVENVSALLNRGLSTVLGDLASIGYDAEWHCIPASAIGAWHRRDRIWIVAYPTLIGKGREAKARLSFISDKVGKRLEKERSKAITNSNGKRQSQPKGLDQELWRRAGNGGEENVSDTNIKRLQERNETKDDRAEKERIKKGCKSVGIYAKNGWEQWEIEPDVGRVVDGFPGRVDRLKQLGNAVVPQIPYLIAKAIVEIEKNEKD